MASGGAGEAAGAAEDGPKNEHAFGEFDAIQPMGAVKEAEKIGRGKGLLPGVARATGGNNVLWSGVAVFRERNNVVEDGAAKIETAETIEASAPLAPEDSAAKFVFFGGAEHTVNDNLGDAFAPEPGEGFEGEENLKLEAGLTPIEGADKALAAEVGKISTRAQGQDANGAGKV